MQTKIFAKMQKLQKKNCFEKRFIIMVIFVSNAQRGQKLSLAKGLFKVNLEFSFSFPGFSFSGPDLVFKSGFQT